MKNHILALVLLFIPLLQYAQSQTTPTLLTIEKSREIINEHRDSLKAQIKDTSRLVTIYTFRELIKEDFSILTSGTDGNYSTIGRFASLKVDQDKLKFSLTPYSTNFSKKHDSNRGLFRNIFSIDMSGTVNTNSRFTWKDRKKVSLGASWTYLREGYNFSSRPNDRVYDEIYEGVQNQLITKYHESSSNALDSLNDSKIYKDSASLSTAFYNQVAEYENKLIAGKWRKKNIWWWKLNVDILSFDFVNYLSRTKLDLGISPKTESYYSPSINVTGNYYGGSSDKSQIFISAGLGFERKNNLTELNKTTSWSMIERVDSSIQINTDNKEIFVTDFEEIETKFLPNASLQIIGLFKFDIGIFNKENVNLGVEVAGSHHLLIKPPSITEDVNSSLSKILFGIIFPMKDKKGKPSVIIEPFVERKFFKNYLEESNNIVGVKFSLPFTQLY